MKHQRTAAEQAVSLAFSLSSLGAVAHSCNRKPCRAPASDEFVCKTCSRSFPTFQALGGHRTSHLLALAWTELAAPKKTENDHQPAAVHRCHVCGLEFEMGQALGGHMRRHRATATRPPQWRRPFCSSCSSS